MKSLRCRQSVMTNYAGKEGWYGTSNKKHCGNENRNEWLGARRLGDKTSDSCIIISSKVRNLCHSRSETHAFHTCAAHFSVFLICLSYRHCPIRLTSLATFPLRGRLYVGDSNALVYDALETILSLSFIPPEPYPARSARHLPNAGNAVKLR